MYLEVNDLCKSYGEGGSYTQVLKNVSLEVPQGDMCVIQGTSGSGKSTLLNCIGGLDTVDSGSIVVDGKEIVGLNAKQLSDYRREELSFPPQLYAVIYAGVLACYLLIDLVLVRRLDRMTPAEVLKNRE